MILIVLAPKEGHTSVQDGSLVLGNLMLAGHALGLGTIWINRAKEEFEEPFYQKLLKKLGIEGAYIGVGHCALGYRSGELPSVIGSVCAALAMARRSAEDFSAQIAATFF